MTAPELLARRFHNLYEHMAPQFGYTTREDTRLFIPESPNGKLMIAVCEALASSPEVAALIAEARREDAKLLLDAYKGVLVLMRILNKAGLVAGASAADQISKRIVDAHPEFPGMASLRALREETP